MAGALVYCLFPSIKRSREEMLKQLTSEQSQVWECTSTPTPGRGEMNIDSPFTIEQLKEGLDKWLQSDAKGEKEIA
jgi:hypothetical protein